MTSPGRLESLLSDYGEWPAQAEGASLGEADFRSVGGALGVCAAGRFSPCFSGGSVIGRGPSRGGDESVRSPEVGWLLEGAPLGGAARPRPPRDQRPSGVDP